MAWMARFPTGFTPGGGVWALARLLVGRVRRRRPGGRCRILREPSLQGLHTVVQLLDLVAQGAHIRLHGRWGLRPVLGGKGTWPDGARRLRPRFHDISRRQPLGSDGWIWYTGDARPAPEENALGARDTQYVTCVCHG
jgi:hypothetical protein